LARRLYKTPKENARKINKKIFIKKLDRSAQNGYNRYMKNKMTKQELIKKINKAPISPERKRALLKMALRSASK